MDESHQHDALTNLPMPTSRNGGHLLGRKFSEEAPGGHGAVHIAAGGRC